MPILSFFLSSPLWFYSRGKPISQPPVQLGVASGEIVGTFGKPLWLGLTGMCVSRPCLLCVFLWTLLSEFHVCTVGLRTLCYCCCCAQSYLTLCDPVDCGSSVHGLLQARMLEWVAISSSRGSSLPRDRTRVSFISYTGRWLMLSPIIFFY